MVVTPSGGARTFVCPVHTKPMTIAHGPKMETWVITHAPCFDINLDHMGQDEVREWARDYMNRVSKAVGFVPQSDESISEWVQSYPGERYF